MVPVLKPEHLAQHNHVVRMGTFVTTFDGHLANLLGERFVTPAEMGQTLTVVENIVALAHDHLEQV